MLDISLVIIFLVYLAVCSFKSYKQIHSINAFSLGIKSISTYALGATITATWVSGSGFILDLTEFYKNGLPFFITALGMCVGLVIIALCIAPKMERFLGKVSIAAIMGEEYGQKVRIITAFCGCFAVSAGIFIQFKIMGEVLHYLMPFLNNTICLLMSSSIVIMYSFIGGINSVVHTDKIQAICFTLALIIGIVLLKSTIKYDPNHIITDLISLNSFHNLNTDQKIDMFLLFTYFLIPAMSPHVVQRISMGINIKQVKDAYLWSAFSLMLMITASCYCSYLLFQWDQHIPLDKMLYTFLDLFNIPGTKGILIIGLISMCMSTADSNLNIGAILVANDIWKPNSSNIFEKLYLARLSTFIIGILSLFFCFQKGSLISILISAYTFYTPFIVIPFFAAIFGFKTTERCVLIAMGITLLYIMVFKFVLKNNLNIVTISMIINLISLIFSHYLIEKWELLKCFGIKSHLKNRKHNV